MGVSRSWTLVIDRCRLILSNADRSSYRLMRGREGGSHSFGLIGDGFHSGMASVSVAASKRFYLRANLLNNTHFVFVWNFLVVFSLTECIALKYFGMLLDRRGTTMIIEFVIDTRMWDFSMRFLE